MLCPLSYAAVDPPPEGDRFNSLGQLHRTRYVGFRLPTGLSPIIVADSVFLRIHPNFEHRISRRRSRLFCWSPVDVSPRATLFGPRIGIALSAELWNTTRARFELATLPTHGGTSNRWRYRVAHALHHAGWRVSSVCLQESILFWKQPALFLRGENQIDQSTCSTVTTRLASDTKRYCSGRIGPLASLTSTTRSARSPCNAGTERSSNR